VRRPARLKNALLTIVVATCAVTAASAQIVPEGYDEGTHIVRAGDTLRGITRAYLGSEDLWERNWRLNPQVKDPDRLFPLQRLRILLAPQIARPTARLITISGDVEGKPAPNDWNRSLEDDLMLERDGIRANEDSSTVMRFTDGSELTLRDKSTVFLRVAGRSLRGIEQRSVEILEGQADLAAVTLPQEAEIEIVIGGAVATPMTGDSGGIEARARRVGAGGAQVMVFEGLSEVESGGTTVTVPQGMGTAVSEAGPPAPPEKLLSAAVGLMPAPGEQFELERSRFSWEAVDGAADYTVELCRDSSCGDLVRRQTAIGENAWEVSDIPPGEYLWRVTAVSGSGLDGYASEARPVQIIENRRDHEPPTGRFVVSGQSVDVDGMTYYGPDLDIRFEVEDEATGIDSVTLMIDGREVAAEVLGGPWATGDYEVTATAVDGSDNSATFGPLEIHVDADPPMIDWTVEGDVLLVSYAGTSEVPSGWAKRSRKWARRELKRFDRGRAEPQWTVLAWSSALPRSIHSFDPDVITRRRSHRRFSLERLQTQVLVFAPALVIEGDGGRLAERLVSIESVDERSGQVLMKIWRRPGPDARQWLEIEAVDRLGNVDVVRWSFSPTD